QLNCKKAIDNISGKSQLYLSLLHDFYHEQQETAVQLQQLMLAEKLDELLHLVHSLKSTSAYIGAFEISKLCGELESLLLKKSCDERALTTICQMLEQLLDDLSPYYA